MTEPRPRGRAALLTDGTDPATPGQLFARLDELGIAYQTAHHPPVYTVEEAKTLRGRLAGAHVKNLFLRNKKAHMWLVTCLEDRRVDLNGLAESLGARRFSFASAERLMEHLGVVPGAVTPFGILNDRGGVVEVVLDRALLDYEQLNFHPLDNAQTTTISPDGLLRFLDAENHPPQWLEFDQPSAPA